MSAKACVHGLDPALCAYCAEEKCAKALLKLRTAQAALPDPPRTHPGDPGEPRHGRPRVGVAPEECELLRRFSHDARVLEIGTGLGFSTRAFIEGGARAVDTVDIDPWVRETIVPALEKEARAAEIPFRAIADRAFIGFGYDIAFIDGAHDFESVRSDAVLAIMSARHGGLIFFHDWTGTDPVARAVESVIGQRYVHVVRTLYGIGVLAVDAETRRQAYESGVKG